MKFAVASDARPQLKTLLIATVISIVLWFIPFAEYLVYPFKLFVTFIHEGGHVLAAILTGSSIFSLTVAPDTSGAVLAAVPNTIAAQLLVSSAGYVGAAAFGALLLILIRRSIQARYVLAGIGFFIAFLTLVFGLMLPTWNAARAEVSFFGMAFTVSTGFLLAAALMIIARYASQKFASFFLSFLAVQCVLNSLFDLKTVFMMSSPFASPVHTDAMNMANATGIPPIVWTFIWIGLSLALISVALRFYAMSKEKGEIQQDLPFED